MARIYGIKNCDTCRKALKWLDLQGISYTFVDIRADGIARKDLVRWQKIAGWEPLVNKRSTTWRNIPVSDREGLKETTSRQLILANPTVMKRPILDLNESVYVGFKEAEYKLAFK